jgi:hypothetical protein
VAWGELVEWGSACCAVVGSLAVGWIREEGEWRLFEMGFILWIYGWEMKGGCGKMEV